MNRKIVIIGSGFGGITLAKALRHTQMEIVLLDKTNHHLFQPLLYQVATASLSPGEIATPTREIFRKDPHMTVLMGEATRIDKKNKTVYLGNGDSITYDTLVIATGASHSYFGKTQWESFAPGLKTIQNALQIREKIFLAFEKAEREGLFKNKHTSPAFVVIGGGPTGVEMAGAIAEIAHKTMFQNFRHIRPDHAKIYLVEALEQILPSYPPSLALKAKKALEKMGVTVITGKKVVDINEKGVQIEGLFVETNNVVWAAGNQASPLVTTLDTPVDRSGRAIVEPDLSIPGDPDVFVIGDAAHVKGKKGAPLPGIAPAAIQQAKYLGHLIKKGLPVEKRKPFSYFDKGSMATIGTGRAIAMVGKFQMSGFIAWLAWGFIHILYLINFRSRFSVMAQWFYSFLTGDRAVRLVYTSIEDELSKKP